MRKSENGRKSERMKPCLPQEIGKGYTTLTLLAFGKIVSVAKARREVIALSMEMLADQQRLYYGKMVTPTPSRVRVHSGPPSFRKGNELHA
jgi:hypothetical protein